MTRKPAYTLKEGDFIINIGFVKVVTNRPKNRTTAVIVNPSFCLTESIFHFSELTSITVDEQKKVSDKAL